MAALNTSVHASQFSSRGASFSRFTELAFEKAAVVDIAQNLLDRRPLSFLQVEHLVNNVEPPVLAKLVEIVHSVTDVSGVRLRPLIFVPLAKILEQHGKDKALDIALLRINSVARGLSVNLSSVFIAIDRWHGNFERDELLEVIYAALSQSALAEILICVGPSTSQLLKLEGNVSGEEDRLSRLDIILANLRMVGIGSIEGGSDIEIHLLAAARGFSLSFGQEVRRLASMRSLGRGQDKAGKQAGFDNSFADCLLAISDKLAFTGKLNTWYPWAKNCVDSFCLDGGCVLGVQLLRAVALGRLLLPNISHVRAPLSLFGVKMAHVALSFGANDFGYAALDAETADLLGISRMSDCVDVINAQEVYKLLIG